MAKTVKRLDRNGNGWTARWESRSARDLRTAIPAKKAIHQMHTVAQSGRGEEVS